MTRHGWLTAPGSPALLFDSPTDGLWEAAFNTVGIDPRLLVGESGAA